MTATKTAQTDQNMVENELEILQRDILRVVLNTYSTRKGIIDRMFDQRRDIYGECGYPTIAEPIGIDFYQQLFDREAIATRIVSIYPKESWKVHPQVYELTDAEVLTPFEWSFKEMSSGLYGDENYYEEEEGNPLWNILERADILCGIGRYGGILIGIDDGLPLDQPAFDDKIPYKSPGVKVKMPPRDTRYSSNPLETDLDPELLKKVPVVLNAESTETEEPTETEEKAIHEDMNADNTPKVLPTRRLQFLRPLSETMLTIDSVDTDPTSKRHGKPLYYSVMLTRHFGENHAGQPQQSTIQNTVKVHYTRILHLADNPEDDDLYGRPRLQTLINPVLGTQKLYCSSPEMYWLGAFFGIAFESYPELGPNVSLNKPKAKESIEQFMNRLSRYLFIPGVKANSLAPQVVDPSPQIRVLLEQICIELGVPLRIFMGSERGELASSQDERAWKDTIMGRQRRFITPQIIIPLINRLIRMGVLLKPKRFCIEWPDLTNHTNAERAATALTRTQAMASYIKSEVWRLIDPIRWLVNEMGMDEKEAVEVTELAKEYSKEKQQEALENQEAQMKLQEAYAPEPEVTPETTTAKKPPSKRTTRTVNE